MGANRVPPPLPRPPPAPLQPQQPLRLPLDLPPPGLDEGWQLLGEGTPGKGKGKGKGIVFNTCGMMRRVHARTLVTAR